MTFSVPARLAKYHQLLSAEDYDFLQKKTASIRSENPEFSWRKICRFAFYALLDSKSIPYESED